MGDELRAKLEERAKEMGRSLNAEIVTSLELALDASKRILTDEQAKGLAAEIVSALPVWSYGHNPIYTGGYPPIQDAKEAPNDRFYDEHSVYDYLIRRREEEFEALMDETGKLLKLANEAGGGSLEHEELMTRYSRVNNLVRSLGQQLADLHMVTPVPQESPSSDRKKKAK
jgi:hypothetical protein